MAQVFCAQGHESDRDPRPTEQEEHMVVRGSTLRAGKQFCAGYHLQRLRGRGAFGSVWEAVRDDETRLALKFLPCGDNVAAAQEIRSIQLVRGLRHAHLVRVERVWCSPGYIVVAMDLADGSLLDLLDAFQNEYRTPLVPNDICHYLGQVARALDFLNDHQHTIDGQRLGIQHCDIKPTNLLLFGETVKVADFGLATPTGTPMKAHWRAGTFGYAAPEVYKGWLTDWTDQYALAVTYYHLRTGRLPFADTPEPLPRDNGGPEPDLSLVPGPEQRILARALNPVPQGRWPSCSELIAQLSRLLT
jgi:serine/threonine protein kinase